VVKNNFDQERSYIGDGGIVSESLGDGGEPDRFIEETLGRTTMVTFLTDDFEDVETIGFRVERSEERTMREFLERKIQPLPHIPGDEQLEIAVAKASEANIRFRCQARLL